VSIFIVLAGLCGDAQPADRAVSRDRAAGGHGCRRLYPGASAETLEQTVAAPLENQITGVEKMIYMSSTSGSNGIVQIEVTFDIGADADQAALNVNNRVKQAEPRLPEEVRRQGVKVAERLFGLPAGACVLLADGRYDNLAISNFVTLNVLDALKRVPGTTNVQIFGAKDYAMRIWVRPDRLHAAAPDADRSDPRAERAERAVRPRQGRTVAERGPAGARLHHHHQGPARRPARVREHHRARQPRRLEPAPEGRGARRARFQGLRVRRAHDGQQATLVGIFLLPARQRRWKSRTTW